MRITYTRKQIREAIEGTGGLSKPSKMPCFSFSIPAKYCATGRVLSKISGSICEICYAKGGFYRMPNVIAAQQKRFEKLMDLKNWTQYMIVLINHFEQSGFFRWFDSGDIQGKSHLAAICEICKATPHIKHWLPTKEYEFVRGYIRDGNVIPDNLTIRLSAYIPNTEGPVKLAEILDLSVSTVKDSGYSCPSSNRGNKCGSCRDCWYKSITTVSYKKH